jgi:hypothetical protein
MSEPQPADNSVDTGAESASQASTSNAGRKGGPVWSHFDKHGTYDNKSRRSAAKCRYCFVVIEAKSSKPEELARHILLKCPLATDAAKTSLQTSIAATVPVAEKPTKKRKQPAITDTFDSVQYSHTISAEVKKQYDHKLLRWLVLAGVPFNAVESVYFLDFLASIRPQYQAPGMVHLIGSTHGTSCR